MHEYLKNKEVFVFTFDDVLYPKKDYLLQVYYLFAEFMEYIEQRPAKALLHAMQAYYEQNGEEGMFDYLVASQGVDEKYRANFTTLHQTARLPLKLLLFQNALNTLKSLVEHNKKIILWLEGKPEVQVNKLKQLEWNNLEENLTTYFADEIQSLADEEPLNYVIHQHGWSKQEVLFVGNSDLHRNLAVNCGIDFLSNIKPIE